MTDPIADIIGDYRAFAALQRDRLLARDIDGRRHARAPHLLSKHGTASTGSSWGHDECDY